MRQIQLPTLKTFLEQLCIMKQNLVQNHLLNIHLLLAKLILQASDIMAEFLLFQGLNAGV